jgi:4-carboxymuconolactone decarboxylase
MSTSKDIPSEQTVKDARDTLYAKGVAIRREVVGDVHVDKSLSTATPFTSPMQDYATEVGWGYIWSRPGLSRKQRSLINLAMLTALGKSQELAAHVKGAVSNGLTEIEIRETLLQAAGYAGFPAGMEGFRVAERVLAEMEEQGELPHGFREKKKDE